MEKEIDQEALIKYLLEKLDKESLRRLLALIEIAEYGWGCVQFTFKKGQIVGYKIEKTG